MGPHTHAIISDAEYVRVQTEESAEQANRRPPRSRLFLIVQVYYLLRGRRVPAGLEKGILARWGERGEMELDRFVEADGSDFVAFTVESLGVQSAFHLGLVEMIIGFHCETFDTVVQEINMSSRRTHLAFWRYTAINVFLLCLSWALQWKGAGRNVVIDLLLSPAPVVYFLLGCIIGGQRHIKRELLGWKMMG